MKYRSYYDVVAQILEACLKNSITKTRVMYVAYISHDKMIEYCEKLSEAGMIKERDQMYSTTGRGQEFLKSYKKLKEMLE